MEAEMVDLHFTVVPFVLGTGDPILCAVIIKSTQEMNDLPL
jgi:hypothetical protein